MKRALVFIVTICAIMVSQNAAAQETRSGLVLGVDENVAGGRIFGNLKNGAAKLTYSVPMLKREIEHNLNDLRLNKIISIHSVTIQRYGGPYYLIAVGKVAKKPIIVAYDLLLDSLGNLYRPSGGIHADMLRSMEGGMRDVCLGENCESCAFTKDATGVITGCTGKSLPGAKPKGYCNHNVSTQVENSDTLFLPDTVKKPLPPPR